MIRPTLFVFMLAIGTSSLAQNAKPDDKKPEEKTKTGSVVGVLAPPIVYYGTKTIGNAPVERFPKDPNRFVGPGLPKFIPGNNCRPGTTIIVVNSSPCYAPFWYSGCDPWTLGQNPWSYFGFQSGNNPWAPVMSAQVGFPSQPLVIMMNGGVQLNQPGFFANNPGPGPSGPTQPDFGQNRNIDPQLQAAVNDVVSSFRSADSSGLMRCTDRNDRVWVGNNAASRRAVPGSVFLQMALGGMQSYKTFAFTLDNIRMSGSSSQYIASGRHVMRTEDDRWAAFEVSYMFQRRTGGWRIVESLARPLF